MSTPSQLPLRVVVLVIAASAPIALGFETLIRTQVFVPWMGAELEELREFYWPTLTPEVRRGALTAVAWALVGVTCVAGLLGVGLQRRVTRRRLASCSSAAEHEQARVDVRDSLLLLTSIPQVPALLATLCFSFGAQLLPVLLSMAASTVFVLVQGRVGERLLAAMGREPIGLA